VTPFLQFRLWLRRGPTSERTAAAVAFLITLALIVWVAIPPGSERSSTSVSAGSGPGAGGQAEAGTAANGATASGSTAGTGAAGSATGAVGGASAGQAGGGPAAGSAAGAAGHQCASLRATDQGVSTTEIFIANPVISLAGAAGNQTFGIRDPALIAKGAQAIAAGINSEGGVACRKLRVKNYEVNPLDPTQAESKCREIIADKPFAVVDNGGFITPASRQCFLDAKIPYEPAVPLSEDQAAAAYPYMWSDRASHDRGARSAVLDAPLRGWWSAQKGFTKLGVLFDECYPKINSQVIQNLHQIGISDAQMSVFTLSGCAQISPPSALSQAVAKHHGDAASHVLLMGNGADSQQYVRQADGIGWKPPYVTSDYNDNTETTLAPMWPDGFDGAFAITSLRGGERNSGITAPWVTHCNDWLRKGGVPTSDTEADQNPMNACDLLRIFAVAANGAGPNLTRPSLTSGLQRAGRFEGAVDTSIALFNGPRKLTGGDFIREIQWHLDCKCFKIVDRDMKPGY